MKILLTVSLALAVSAPALAQQASPQQVIAFLDKDKDGKCSLQEYLAYQVTRIEQFDANKDGALQYVEFRESLAGEGRKNSRRSFDAFNTEELPRALTQREFLGYHALVFKQYVDTDKDGFMSATEWSTLMAAL